MNAALTAVLALIQQLLPLISSGSAATGVVASIVNVLKTWLPLIVTEVQALYEPVKNIITVLQQSGNLTDDQIADLKTVDAKVDAAYDAAVEGMDPDEQTVT
jgi:predicted transglutaminase-like cysteine proteinase